MSSTEIRGPADVAEDQAEAVNEVRLVGRLAADPRCASCRAATRCGTCGSWSSAPAAGQG